MFYLLYDNRIIDSQKEDVYVYEFQIHKWLHKNNEHKTCFGLLKNQSENVFDLIEEGDLLYIPFDCNGMIVHRFDMFKCYKYNAFHCSIHIVHEKGIFAIYKPDDEGNYIKVWERKE